MKKSCLVMIIILIMIASVGCESIEMHVQNDATPDAAAIKKQKAMADEAIFTTSKSTEPDGALECTIPMLLIDTAEFDDQPKIGESSNGSQGVKNPFFFSNETTELTYNCKYEAAESYDNCVVKLQLIELGAYKNGHLYKTKLEGLPDIQALDLKSRITFDYFYIEADKIYKIQSMPIGTKNSKENGLVNGILVCQENEFSDVLGKDEKGWHYFIKTDANLREYHRYNNTIETGYQEQITWEKGKGMTSFLSGYGAERDHIELILSEKTD